MPQQAAEPGADGWITFGPFGVDPESGFPGVTIRRRPNATDSKES